MVIPASAVIIVIMPMVPIMAAGVFPMPIAAPRIVPMNPAAMMTIAGNPNPTIPLVPVVRTIVKAPVSNTDREIDRLDAGRERSSGCQD
jgi:hypothetical protein